MEVRDTSPPIEGQDPDSEDPTDSQEPDQSTPQTVSEPAGEDFPTNPSTSGQVAVGDTATGRIGSMGDGDWFAVELGAGREYRIDLKGSPTGDGTLIDPYFRGVYDEDGNFIPGTVDDDGGEGRNSRETFTADADGTYYLGAGAFSIRTGTYTLSVEEVEVDSPVAQTVSEPAGEDFSANPSTSGRVAVGDAATGRIGSIGDRDWFAVELEAGREYRIDLKGSSTGEGTLNDPYFRGVYDEDGNFIPGTEDDDGGEGNNSRETFTADADGTYYLGASTFSSGRGTYTLSVEEGGGRHLTAVGMNTRG